MKWNSNSIKYENHEKKKVTTLWSKTHNQKTRLKAPQRVAEKNLSGPTYDTSYLSPRSYDLQLSSYQRIVKIKWNGDNWTIQNTTWLADERCTLLVQNVSWNTGDPNIITCLYKIILNQSIIRCNYTDKSSYWK